jgi:hypothetical protein
MSDITKCPNCGAEERGDHIPGVNVLRWECGNWEDNTLMVEPCLVRRREARYTKLQSAWIGMKTELMFLAHSDPKNEAEMIEIIHRWEDEAIFIPGKDQL